MQMDELNYFYDWLNPTETDIHKRELINTNRLHHVSDAVASGYNDDIDNTIDNSSGGTDGYNLDYKGQTKTNNKRQDGGVDDYEYDELGALVRNRNEEIKEIEWTFARKVKKITRFNWSAKPDVEFVYDALGRRIGKVVKPKNLTTKAVLPMDSWTVTYYALDASGKQFATYDLKFNNTSQQVETVKLNEHHLYGASRLGVANRNEIQTGAVMLFAGVKSRILGKKSFELPNHLGSVMAVVSDRKFATEEQVENTIYGSGFDGGDYDMFRSINLEQNKVVEFQDFEDGHMDGIVSNTSGLTIGGGGPGDPEKRLIITTNAKFAGAGKIYQLEKNREYKLSWNYQRNSSVDGWFEFRDAITGNLLGVTGQMNYGAPSNAVNNTYTFVATTSMLYVKFFRGNDYDVSTNNGTQNLYIDKLTLETTEKALVSYEEMVVNNPNNNTNALYLSNSGRKYGPEMYIPVKPGATLVSAVIKAWIDPSENPTSQSLGGVLEADFQLADNTPVYEKVGNSYVSLWRGSANATNSSDDYSVSGLPTLPTQVYDANGKPYDMAKTQFYLRVMPFIPDGQQYLPTLFDDLVVELRENATGTKVFYTADIQQSSDYYAFGSPQVGRTHGSGYRFGYQGSEKDDEVNQSDGTSYTTEFRQLDPRLGRWFSVDPVFQPWQSPYVSMNNNPINYNDPMGLVGETIKIGGVEYTLEEVDPSSVPNPNGTSRWKTFKVGEGMRNKDGVYNYYRVKENGKFVYYKLSRVASEAEKKKEAEVKLAEQERKDAEAQAAKDAAEAEAKIKEVEKQIEEKAEKVKKGTGAVKKSIKAVKEINDYLKKDVPKTVPIGDPRVAEAYGKMAKVLKDLGKYCETAEKISKLIMYTI